MQGIALKRIFLIGSMYGYLDSQPALPCHQLICRQKPRIRTTLGFQNYIDPRLILMDIFCTLNPSRILPSDYHDVSANRTRHSYATLFTALVCCET